MGDVKQCETLFKQLVGMITSVYGNEVTSNEDLITIGRAVFKPLGNNVIRNCDYDFKRMNGKSILIMVLAFIGVQLFKAEELSQCLIVLIDEYNA